MHSLVGLDARRARRSRRCVTWGDTRATEQAERLRAEHPELHDRTGTPLHPMSPLAKLVWFAEHEPETFAAVRRWAGIKELVLARLTGDVGGRPLGRVGHGPARPRDARLGRARRSRSRASTPTGSRRSCPTTHRLELGAAAAADLGLDAGHAVIVGAGDGPLANLGLGAVRPGVAACSIGTSGALRLMVERPAVDPQRRRLLLRAGAGALDRRRRDQQRRRGAALGRRGAGARPRRRTPRRSCSSWPREVPAGSEGLLMLPYLLSERAPHWSSVPRGAYVGLTRHHGRGHLVRAALEGVCLQLALVLASVRDAGNEVREIRATGGFARSDLWRQMLADALGMPVGFPAGHEGSAFGAALLAWRRSGWSTASTAPPTSCGIEDVVEPEAGRRGRLRRPAAHLRLALRRAGAGLSRPGAPPLSGALGGPDASCP